MPNEDYTFASITELTHWVADKLDEETWSLEFEEARYYIPLLTLKEIRNNIVSVYPITVDSTISPRCSTTDDCQIVVHVYGRCVPGNLSKQDELVRLAEEIRDYFRRRVVDQTLPTGTDLYNSRLDSISDNDVLSEYNLFSSRLTLDFKMRRETATD